MTSEPVTFSVSVAYGKAVPIQRAIARLTP